MSSRPRINRTAASLVIPLLFACATVLPGNQATTSPSQEYLRFAIKACDQAESQLPEIVRVAEIVADRCIKGGTIGFPRVAWYQGHGLEEELCGRSGQMMHVGFDRACKTERTATEQALDVVLMGWTREPKPDDLSILQKFKEKQCYIVGFGPRRLSSLAEHVKLCDAWFDTGSGADDRAVKLPDGSMAGRINLLTDVLNAWTFMGEVISACTRRGKMPPIAKAFLYEDGLDWWNRYFQKQAFHEDFKVSPIPSGKLGREYLKEIRKLVQKYEQTQLPAVANVAERITEEGRQGKKTVVAAMGHMAWAFAGKDEGVRWAMPIDLHHNYEAEVAAYVKETPDAALALRLGYSGHHQGDDAILRKKHQRVMLVTSANPRPEFKLPDDLLTKVDMGFEFGDACLAIEGYPVRILPPSGVMQIVAYETINLEVLARLCVPKSAAGGAK